jgi:hypothetical protein
MRNYRRTATVLIVVLVLVLVCCLMVRAWHLERESSEKADTIVSVLRRDANEAERQAAALPLITDKSDLRELEQQNEHARDRMRTWTEVLRELRQWVEPNLPRVHPEKRQELQDVWVECESRIRHVIERFRNRSAELSALGGK